MPAGPPPPPPSAPPPPPSETPPPPPTLLTHDPRVLRPPLSIDVEARQPDPPPARIAAAHLLWLVPAIVLGTAPARYFSVFTSEHFDSAWIVRNAVFGLFLCLACILVSRSGRRAGWAVAFVVLGCAAAVIPVSVLTGELGAQGWLWMPALTSTLWAIGWIVARRRQWALCFVAITTFVIDTGLSLLLGEFGFDAIRNDVILGMMANLIPVVSIGIPAWIAVALDQQPRTVT